MPEPRHRRHSRSPASADTSSDLYNKLKQGKIVEQRSFILSFVKRIEVKPPRVAIAYTIPLKPDDGGNPLTGEVLTFAQPGSPDATFLEQPALL